MVRPYLPAQDSGQGQREEAERWILVGFHLLRGGCSRDGVTTSVIVGLLPR